MTEKEGGYPPTPQAEGGGLTACNEKMMLTVFGTPTTGQGRGKRAELVDESKPTTPQWGDQEDLPDLSKMHQSAGICGDLPYHKGVEVALHNG